jgi:hypothetical protein
MPPEDAIGSVAIEGEGKASERAGEPSDGGGEGDGENKCKCER